MAKAKGPIRSLRYKRLNPALFQRNLQACIDYSGLTLFAVGRFTGLRPEHLYTIRRRAHQIPRVEALRRIVELFRAEDPKHRKRIRKHYPRFRRIPGLTMERILTEPITTQIEAKT